MPKPPVKKIVGVKYKRTPGAVVQKGKPAVVTQTAERGAQTVTYKPRRVETGDPRYGKARPEGTPAKSQKALEMESLLTDAEKRGTRLTKPSSEGLVYKAQDRITESGAPRMQTTLKVTPQISKVKDTITPITKSKATSGGKLKARSLTLGGSDKHGGPGTFKAVGTYGGIRRRRPR